MAAHQAPPSPGSSRQEHEWVAITFSDAWKWKVKVKSLSCVWLFKTRWTATYKAPLSMGFSRQEYWSGVPLPSLLVMPSTPQVQRCGGWYSAFLPQVFLRTMGSHSAWESKGVKTPRSNFSKWRLSQWIKSCLFPFGLVGWFCNVSLTHYLRECTEGLCLSCPLQHPAQLMYFHLFYPTLLLPGITSKIYYLHPS